MNLDRVTITGADESVEPADLAALSIEFPFAEWGILVSKSGEGRPRFPARAWTQRLLDTVGSIPHVQLSLHVCGRWVRQLMLGQDDLLGEWGPVDRFQRLQLNFHAQRQDFAMRAAVKLFERSFSKQQIIVQMDGTKNEDMFWWLRRNGLDCVPLFDTSGGAGLVPAEWPRPFTISVPYHGYAGGLGPDTVRHEVERIGQAAGDERIWIDMERRVRSRDDEALDLDKVRQVLAITSAVVS